MSSNTEFAKAYLVRLTGIEEGNALIDVFAGILGRQIDANNGVLPTSFGILSSIFGYVATPAADREEGATPTSKTDQVETIRQEVEQETGLTPTNPNAQEPVAPTFSLTEGSPTEAAAAADATASVATVEASDGVLAGVASVSVTIGEGDDAQTITVEGIEALTTGASALVDALNADEAFAEAGLVAAYENGALTITDAQGRALSGVELFDDGQSVVASTATIDVLSGVFRGTANTLTLVIDGEEVVVDDIQANADTSGSAEVAAYIQQEVRGYEVTTTNAQGIESVSNPFAGVTVKFADGTLTITDEKGRQIENVTLVDAGDDAVPSTANIALTTAQAQEALYFELQLAGEDEPVSVTLNAAQNGGNNLATALNEELADTDISVAYNGSLNRLEITDAKGRDIVEGSVKLQGEATGVVETQAVISGVADGIANLDVGRLSATIGQVEVNLADVDISTGGRNALATEMQTVLRAADGDAENISVVVEEGNIVITDAAGRAISNVQVMDSGADAVTTGWSVAGISEADVADIDVVRLKVAGLNDDETIVIDKEGDTQLNTDTQAEFAASIQTALNALEGAQAAFTVAFNDDGELIITDTVGRALSNIQVLNTQGAVPSSATITGLTNAISADDVASFSVTVGDREISLADVTQYGADATETPPVPPTTVESTEGLAAAIQAVLQGALDDSISATASKDGTSITITDEAGRSISNLSIATEGATVENEEVEASTAELFDVDVDALVAAAEAKADNTNDVDAIPGVLSFDVIDRQGNVLIEKTVTVPLNELDYTAVEHAENVTFGADGEDLVAGDYSVTVGETTYTVTVVGNETDGFTIEGSAEEGGTATTVTNLASVVSALASDVQADTDAAFGAAVVPENGTTLVLTATEAGSENAFTATASAPAGVTTEVDTTASAQQTVEAALKKLIDEKVKDANIGVTDEEEAFTADINVEVADSTITLTNDEGYSFSNVTMTKDGAVKNQFLDLSDASSADDLDGLTIKLADLVNGEKGNLIDGGEGVKSNNLVKLPSEMAKFTGALTIENATVSDKTKTKTKTKTNTNDIIDVPGLKATDIANIEASEGDQGYVTFTVTLKETPAAGTDPATGGGTITLKNLLNLPSVLKATAELNDGTAFTSLEELNDAVEAAEAAEAAEGGKGVTALFNLLTTDGTINVTETADTDSTGRVEVEVPDELPSSFDLSNQAGSQNYAGEIVLTEGTPVGAGGDALGTVTIDNGFTEDGRPAGEVYTVGDEPQLDQEGVIAGTGAEPVAQVAVEYIEGSEGERADVGGDVTIENGQQGGLNAEQVGAAAEIENGNTDGANPQLVAEATVENGTPATDATAWTATFAIDFEGELEEAYTFNLTLNEVVEEGAEATDPINFTSGEVAAGSTAADALEALVANIDASEAFAAALNDEGQLVVTAADLGTNYEAVPAVELVAVEEAPIVEAA